MNRTVRHYQPGDEQAEISLDQRIVMDWPWPSGYTLQTQERLLADPLFDPNHRIYAFDGEAMVGLMHVFSIATRLDGTREAFASFPKVLPGHEDAIEPMLDRAIAVLRGERVATISVWAHTALPGAFAWLENHGYVEHPDYPKGIKKYVTYDLSRGSLAIPHADVDSADETGDTDAIAYAVSIWNNCSMQQAKKIYARWLETLSTIDHLVVRPGDEITASALISRNSLRPSTAAFEYVYAREPNALRQLVSKAVEACIAAGAVSFLVDLIGAHHHFEPTYLDMGFELAVVHGWYSRQIG